MVLNAISFWVVTGLSSFFNPSNVTPNPAREDEETRQILKRVKARLREMSDTMVLNQRLSTFSVRFAIAETCFSSHFPQFYWDILACNIV